MAAAPDGIALTVSRTQDVALTLHWTATIPTYTVFRSTHPATVVDPANKLGDTSANSWTDTPPAGNVFYYAVVGNCPAGQAACGGLCEADTDGDTFCDHLDYCVSDPQKVERGRCGCFKAEDVRDDDDDGVINCLDQCPGSSDAQDADRGGLPDACDPCPTGLCSIALPDRFYVELPNHQARRVSRNGRWIAAREASTGRGVLIPTEELIRNPSDTSYYAYMGDETVLDIRGFSDDDNFVLANISAHVPQSSSELSVAAVYDRTNGSWTVLGLYDDAINVDACRFYSFAGDMTSNGRIVYGRTPTVAQPCKNVGFHHDAGTEEWQLFGGPEGTVHRVEAASGDGGRIVGSEIRTLGGRVETGVIWTYQAPDTYLPQWMPDLGAVYDVTFDGSAASLSSGTRACRWTAIGGVSQLGPGTLDPSYGPRPVAISDSGNHIAGYHVSGLSSRLPFMWVQGWGFGNLYEYLIYRGFSGAELGQFSNSFLPFDLSGNGSIIVGQTGALSGLPGWVAITRN